MYMLGRFVRLVGLCPVLWAAATCSGYLYTHEGFRGKLKKANFLSTPEGCIAMPTQQYGAVESPSSSRQWSWDWKPQVRFLGGLIMEVWLMTFLVAVTIVEMLANVTDGTKDWIMLV